jgi:hypothetical protein
MGLFGGRKDKPLSPEMAILRAIGEIDPHGDGAMSRDVSAHLGGMRVTSSLELLETQGLIERGRRADGMWADRLTEQGWQVFHSL